LAYDVCNDDARYACALHDHDADAVAEADVVAVVVTVDEEEAEDDDQRLPDVEEVVVVHSSQRYFLKELW